VLNQVLAAPATRTVRRIPTEVALGPEDGMPVSCVLSLDNLTLIRLALCTSRIARLGPARLAAVCEALRTATRC
jgi:mRNA interferase MazF